MQGINKLSKFQLDILYYCVKPKDNDLTWVSHSIITADVVVMRKPLVKLRLSAVVITLQAWKNG